ncbi:MAG TPA: histidine phosphatase family protein [Candidatus Binatia bacterium]|nr:histidine phosphatase family protein [Candidatus Binatia bacterium]
MQPFPGQGLFFLLRHGATDWNVEHRVMGRRSIPLSDDGRRQVRSLVPHLAGLGIATVWTSPLARARETAEIVAAELGGLPVREEEGLTEVHYGSWEGKTFRDLLGDPEYHEFQIDPIRRAVPGGGETLLAVRRRIEDAMARIARASDGAPALVVSHGDPLRLVLAGCLRLDLAEFRRLRVDNGALSAIRLTGDWAEVKFVNMRPDLSEMIRAGERGARAERAGALASEPVQGGG